MSRRAWVLTPSVPLGFSTSESYPVVWPPPQPWSNHEGPYSSLALRFQSPGLGGCLGGLGFRGFGTGLQKAKDPRTWNLNYEDAYRHTALKSPVDVRKPQNPSKPLHKHPSKPNTPERPQQSLPKTYTLNLIREFQCSRFL